MAKQDWYEIKFLESADNLKAIVQASVGRAPSTGVANEIAVCIQQGRLFFEAASDAPPQIQPLLVFYGVAGFAKAIVLARKVARLCTLVQSHGLTDKSQQNTTLDGLELKFEKNGTFQHFNDAIGPLGRIRYYDKFMPKWLSHGFDTASGLEERTINITDILSRIPKLQRVYERTFQKPANTISFMLNFGHDPSQVELRIDDDKEHFSDKATLKAIVHKWRSRWPFLNSWCFDHAGQAWGNTILMFSNREATGLDEFAADLTGDGSYQNDVSKLGWTDFLKIIPPLTGGLNWGNYPYAIQPFAGKYLSELSWQFLGCFLLSTLVRYRPQVWQHAVSRSVSAERPADDKSLALIEQFTGIVMKDFPDAVVNAIDYLRPPS